MNEMTNMCSQSRPKHMSPKIDGRWDWGEFVMMINISGVEPLSYI